LSGLKITTHGFPELTNKLDRMGDEIQREAGRLSLDGARRMESLAKELAPVDYGILKGLIIATPEGQYGAKLEALAGYSAYLEFGTGTKVEVPAELIAYAEQFRGARPVIGINAHPYFFPAFDAIAPSVIADVEAMLQEVADKK
jgi:hypothetical protein